MRIGFDDRPHPGPLPQEREKRSAVADVFGCGGLFVGLAVNPEATAATQKPSTQKATRESCPLSPGARVRVRASVLQTYFPGIHCHA